MRWSLALSIVLAACGSTASGGGGGDDGTGTDAAGSGSGSGSGSVSVFDPSVTKVVVEIDYAKATFTMSVDGATLDAMSMTPPLASAQATLAVGVTYTGGITSQWAVLTDNVVVDLQ